MTSVRPLEFNASANSITGTDAVTLTVTSPTLKLNGTTKTSVVGELELLDSLIFANAGSEANRFTIAEDGVTGNYVINNEVNNKDVIFKANLGGTATEVMRVDGSAGSLLMEGEQQLQFAVAANYISSTSGSAVNRGLNIITAGSGDLNTTTGGDFNLTATGELDINANTVSVTAPAITKTLTSETMISAVTKSPKLTIANSTNDAFGGVLEFNKSANELEDRVIGTIKGTGASNKEYAKIDFISKIASAAPNQVGSIVFTAVNADGGTSGQHIQVMDINQGLQNTVSIGTTDNPADLKVYGDLLASSTAYFTWTTRCPGSR
jgi:hypothetical protein